MRLPGDASQQQQLTCSFPFWYPLFEKVALNSIHLPLPPDFVSFLIADGVYLGDSSRALPRRGEADSLSGGEEEEDQHADDNCSQSSSGSGFSTSEEDESRDFLHQFPELRSQIQEAIEQLGGRVVPKLNWSCPTDATWINPGGSLACDNADQVVLMLKSSDRITHDLELLSSLGQVPDPASQASPQATTTASTPEAVASAEGSNSDSASGGRSIDTTTVNSSAPSAPTQPSASSSSSSASTHALGSRLAPSHPILVLRKWYDLRPEREWRCFVRGGDLVGVCQRDVTQHFPQLTLAADLEGSHSSHSSMMVVGSNGIIRQRQPGHGSSGQTGFDRARDEPGREALQAAQLLENFFESRIRGRFPLADFTFDAYVATNNTVKLLDFNPVGGTTSPLLFTWRELGLDQAVGEHQQEEEAEPAAGAEEGSQGEHRTLQSEQQGEHGHTQGQAGGVSNAVQSGSSPQQAPSGNDSGGVGGKPGGSGDGDQESSEEDGSVSSDDEDDITSRVLVRIVPSAGMVQPGQKAVCGMPIDMLQLKESVEGLVRLMSQQQQQQQQGQQDS